ncbi:MAG: cell division protein ZapA [Lachnospiraceae bacterium]|nr:cell division protein ZapA [Lachnospiraceae bacterium]
MTEKTDVQVVIDGKVLTISGYESEEHLQKIASFINNKISEYQKVDAFKHANSDTQHRLIELNITDEYFKAKRQIGQLEEEIKAKQNELYDMKHDIVNKDMVVDSLRENIKQLQDELHESAKRIVQLETELRDRKR